MLSFTLCVDRVPIRGVDWGTEKISAREELAVDLRGLLATACVFRSGESEHVDDSEDIDESEDTDDDDPSFIDLGGKGGKSLYDNTFGVPCSVSSVVDSIL